MKCNKRNMKIALSHMEIKTRQIFSRKPAGFPILCSYGLFPQSHCMKDLRTSSELTVWKQCGRKHLKACYRKSPIQSLVNYK